MSKGQLKIIFLDPYSWRGRENISSSCMREEKATLGDLLMFDSRCFHSETLANEADRVNLVNKLNLMKTFWFVLIAKGRISVGSQAK